MEKESESALKPLKVMRKEFEKRAIEKVLASCNGSKVRAAEILGIGKTSLFEKSKNTIYVTRKTGKERIEMMITRAISDRLVGAEGKIGISYIDLSEEAELFFGNNKVFPGSGAVMIMALVECFRQLERGVIKKEDKYRFKHAEFGHSEDQSFGVLRFLHEGAELTLSDLYNLVGIISDNMAFNKLVDILGMDNIRNTFNSLGY